MTSSAFPSGTIIDERYEVIEHIGDGGMGNVFKTRELGLERIVAVKMIHPSLLGDDETLSRFKREGTVLSQLNHPNLLRCYRFGLAKGNTPYIAMEYLEGESLSNLIASKLSPDRVLRLARQICQGMAHAHKANVIHRDLKPTNIMILSPGQPDEHVKVLDFGLAGLLADDNVSSKQHLTRTGTVIGSVFYMSPEQCMGRKTDVRSDIYSVGCILYESLTGTPPLVADTPVGLMHLHTKEYPPSLSQALPQVKIPEGLNDVVMRAMAKAPDHRYQSMADLDEDLMLVASGRGKIVPRFVIEVAKPAKDLKKPVGLLCMSIALILVLALCTTSFLVSRKQGATPKPWVREEPKTDAQDLVSYKLLKTPYPAELKLDPARIEAWIEKFGSRNLYDRVHANSMLFRANRLTLDRAIKLIKEDLDVIISTGPVRDYATQIEFYRACRDYLYLLQLKLGRERGYKSVEAMCRKSLIPQLQRRFREESSDVLRWSGLFEEQLAFLRSMPQLSGRDNLNLACCLQHLGKLTKAEKAKAIAAFRDLGKAETDWNDMFYVYRDLLELNDPQLALDYSGQNQVRTGQFEECYRAICMNRVGKFIDAEEILQNPTMGDYRLPVRLWNSMSLKKEKYMEVHRDLLSDFRERTHDPRAVTRTSYFFSKQVPDAGKIAMENALAQMKSNNYLDGYMSISYVAATLNHQGQPERAQRFIDSRNLIRPKTFASVSHEEIVIMLEYSRSLRLQKKYAEAKLKLGNLKNSIGTWPSARQFTEALMLAESARLARDCGDFPAADSLYAKAFACAEDKVEVTVIDKVRILEEHAKLCTKMGNNPKYSALIKRSHRLLAPECRKHWTTWMPLAPDYMGLRTIEDLD
ncbi:MAG: serine/threonine protein kinase [Candidatus Obscuribacterales bacterium]|nr:serine/threonine protein kinase [Candidatus Obscuribacterales bacterium]